MPDSAYKRHLQTVHQDFLAADKLLSRYVGPTHIIRVELAKLIEEINTQKGK